VPDLFPGPVLASLRAGPDRPAVEAGPRTVSRGDLLALVRRLAAALRDAGLGPGKGVGLVLSLSVEAYATHLAAHALGCRVAAARPGWSPGQLGHALDRQVDAVVADTPLDRPALPLGELLDRPDPGGSVPELARPDDIARLTLLCRAERRQGLDGPQLLSHHPTGW
jgi:fatty-acyl-CoA synthase